MKRFYSIFVALCAVLLPFCTKDDSFAGDMPTGGEPDETPLSEIRSVDEALGELSDLMDVIDDKQTRSGKYRTIRSISVSGGAATRGSENPLPDTLVYVVNFDNEEGFAILGAYRALPPVYAITESGTFDASELDMAIASSQAEQAKIAAMSEEERAALFAEPSEEDEEEPFEDMGPAFVTSLIADNIVGRPITPTFPRDSFPPVAKDSIPKFTIGDLICSEPVDTTDWTMRNKKGPYVNTKWGQGEPFNKKCKEYPKPGNNNNTHAKVGCVPVAVGQILTANAQPGAIAHFKFDFSTSDYSYDILKTTFTYDKKSEENNDAFSVTHLAGFLHDLGHWNYCRVTYGEKKSGATDSRARRTLEKMGYSNADLMDYNTSKVRNMISAGKPVYISGYSIIGDKGGHAWVIDGMCERVRTIRYKHTYEFTSSSGSNGYFYKYTTESETQNLLHCNIGWKSNYDGYYLEGIFDMRRMQCPEENLNEMMIYIGFDNYAKELKIITY